MLAPTTYQGTITPQLLRSRPRPEVASESSIDDQAVSLTERGHQVLSLTRIQDGLPSSWLSDFIRAELDRRLADLLADDGEV